jgi:hypothetical protein
MRSLVLSTKNLARTVIEGGRSRYNTWDRRRSNATLRGAERAYAAMLRDPEAWWSLVPPARRKVHRDFHDRLGPVYRWMDRHCGRPWVDVRAEIFRRFDTRTLAGRHIVFDHMLREVLDRGEPREYDWRRYRVDEGGLLQPMPRRRHVKARTWLTREETEELRAFAGERKVRQVGSAHFWLEMTFVSRPPRGPGVQGAPTGRYRQARRLTDAEVKRLLRLSTVARATLLVGLDSRRAALAVSR